MPAMFRLRSYLFAASAALGVLFALPANAADDDDPFAPELGPGPQETDSGPELGLRLGVTTGSGDFESGDTLASSVSSVLPLWVDAGYRFEDRWFAGFYWQYGLGVRSATSIATCPDCVHNGIRYGVQVNYSVVRRPTAHVWVGLGVGHQSFETVNEATKRGTAYSGWEPLNLQFGSSWRPTSGLEFGPFFALAYTTINSKGGVCYSADRNSCPAQDRTSLTNAGPIWWSTFGVRAVFLP